MFVCFVVVDDVVISICLLFVFNLMSLLFLASVHYCGQHIKKRLKISCSVAAGLLGIHKTTL